MRTVALILVAALAIGPASVARPVLQRYTAMINRDERGVAHVKADDWGSLGYGTGFAFAQDRACTLIDQIVKVRGERSRWLGPGVDNRNVDMDFGYRHLKLWEGASKRWAHQPARINELVNGYVAGFNESLRLNGVNGGWCQDAGWVRSITSQDLYAHISDVLMTVSSSDMVLEIGRAQPPSGVSAPRSGTLPAPLRGGSNGWALGSDRSTTGGGLLLANPHYPWTGENRLWETHQSIPGQLNVYGVSISGIPLVQLGFTDAVAWTATVAAGRRFALYSYDLDPRDPTAYYVDGQRKTMIADPIAIDVAGEHGLSRATRTLYSTNHGPVVDVDTVGWTETRAVAIADANAETNTALMQYLAMGTARSMDQFQQAFSTYRGIPWMNTVSASADGRAWIVDASATPNLSPEALQAWAQERDKPGLAKTAFDTAGLMVLNGSNSLFDWTDSPDAAAPGLIGYQRMPQLERRDYVFNANDSMWLANPNRPLTGYQPQQGGENLALTPRTKTNAQLLREKEKWNADDVIAALFSDRAVLADQLRAPLVRACTQTPVVAGVDLHPACAALAGWDGRFTVGARGAIVFREWLSRFTPAERKDRGRLFADASDPSDPLRTPAVTASDTKPWLEELSAAVRLLERADIPVDTPLGDRQREFHTGRMLPVGGGTDIEGAANIVDCCSWGTSSQPIPYPGERLAPGTELRAIPGKFNGYPIQEGDSFVMALQYGSDGPNAKGILVYGNPDDPTNSAYNVGAESLSAEQLRPLAFTDNSVADATVSSITVTQIR
ncbi:hypothetical protein FZI91_22940 [Mycobacterium sp. CBMA271]|nr:hypothetical protein [Mycobacteroides sp. CBMA 326]MUM24536.1 hypothetical protein [Mycobacteroides sp. CBMA 271]